MPRNHQFLEAVLGAAGAGALFKAAERSVEIQNALLPRAVLAWIKVEQEHAGELPGIVGSYVSFCKSDTGFDGSVAIGDELYKFEGASLFHLAASVAVAIDADAETSVEMKDLDIERLGKSIDLLAQRTRLMRLLKSSELEDEELSDEDYEKKHGKKRFAKTAGPGKPSGAIAPTPPTAPTAKAPAPTTTPMKSAKAKAPVKLSLSEAAHKCSLCGSAQFTGPRFTGCLCLGGLAKSARVLSADAEGFVVQLSSDWDSAAVATLLEAVGRT